ncbi:MAG: hypothetical protein QN187_04125 [Armatimonadota bacterium]|nr:hypothetical protein [Armatimonadota bacterium]MDR7519717.1 hypothetical protein [Armatimonadota bacterium]MDR7549138.1 hypothetical protein [Armatimonadota bacterium]
MSRARWVWLAGAVAALALAGGGVYYTRARPAARPPAQAPRDPGLALILAIRTLERSPETRLTREQIAQALPFVRALKDVPPHDAEAAAVIAEAVRRTFTPHQRAALEEARQRFRERVQARRGSGAGAAGDAVPPGAFPGTAGAALSDDQRAQFRTRAFERMIRYLERRMKE